MKKYLKIIMVVMLTATIYEGVQAQKKKTIKKHSKTTSVKAVKFTPVEFGSPTSVSDIKDESDSNAEYQSVKNLIEKDGVTIAYADNTFRPKDPLRRGDFIVAINSALQAVKKAADSSGVDSSAVNAYNKSQSDVTSVSEIKDLQENSIYYPATQSLVERWGVAAPFSKTKLLNAGEPVPENDVYDVLKGTFGYESPGSNPYSTGMTRAKFALVLDNVIKQKLSEVNAVVAARTDSLDDMRRQQGMALKQQEKASKDSLAKEAELSKIDAQKKESEAWNKLSDREKRKQAREMVAQQKHR